MEAVQTANAPSFESVWALLQENAIQHDREMKELREIQKETARQMQKTDSELGKLGKRMGEVVEYMVAPNLRKKFKEFGFNFSQCKKVCIKTRLLCYRTLRRRF